MYNIIYKKMLHDKSAQVLNCLNKYVGSSVQWCDR